MSITSAIIISGDLIIESGQTSAGLLVEGLGNVFIENGGVLEDSVATSQGMITVDPGGLLQRTDVEEDAFIVIDGTAEEITARNLGTFGVYAGGQLKSALLEAGGRGNVGTGATATNTCVDGGYFMLYGGTGENTVVSSGGSFVVQLETGKAVMTTVLNGGIMRLVSAGTAETTTISGGFLEVSSGAATSTILSGGSMRVNEGDTVQHTTLNGGKMEIIAATAIATVVNGAEVRAVSASTLQDLTMNGGSLTLEGGLLSGAIVDSGAFLSVSDANIQSLNINDDVTLFFASESEMSEIVINGGTGSFTGVSMNGLWAGSTAIVSLDETSLLSGRAAFADGASVTLAGTTVAFDTALVTETEAQIQGLSAVTGDAVYTLNAAPEIGIYLLATGAPADFDDEIVLNGSTVSLQVNTPVVIGELVYLLNLDDTGDLSFSIEENVTPSLAFVNSEWSDLEPGATVPVGGVTATVGINAFATGDEAVTALAGKEDPKIRIAGGTAAFSNPITIYTTVYKGAEIISPNVAATGRLVVNSGATVSGSATFEKGASITINGKVLFDTAYASAESAQYVLNGIPGGKATFELKEAKANPGEYLLLSGLSSFEDPVTFGEYTLEVGADPVTTGGRVYQLSFADDNLVLTVEKDTKPTPTIVYVNSEWQDIYHEGDSIRIDDETYAVFGYDAFLDGDAAVEFIDGDTSVSRDLVFLSGGTLSSMVGFDSFTLDPDYLVTLDGKFTGTAITINAADFNGFTRRVLIATDGFGEILPAVTVVGEGFGKEFLDDGRTLLVTSDLVEDSYANAEWTEEDVKDQFVGDMALVWNQNAFSSFKAAANAMRDAGYTIYLTGGTSAEDVQTKFANDVVITANTTGTVANSITGMNGGVLTVESDFTAATVAGFSALTVRAGSLDGEFVSFGSLTVTEGLSLAENGALYLDLTDYKPENTALVNGPFHLTETQTCTLTITDDQPLGVYHLATGAVGFEKTVSIKGSTITLTVGAPPVRDGDTLRTFQLSLTEANELELTIAKYRPPLGYVNSEWTGLEDGTPVTIGETTATIGFDAFATLAQGIAGVADDGEVEIVGGEVSFAEGYSKTITVDAGATVVGKAAFDKAITINGTIAFDTANATAEAAQFTGFSFVTGSTTTSYTLTAETPAVGIYLLASDAAAFDSTVQFGDVTLTVGAEATIIGKYTYALSLNEGVLALAIEDYIPALAYVNSEWTGLEDGTPVTIGETTATIGIDAFAALAPAIAAVTDDGTVEIAGGTVSFAEGYSKTITVDTAATVVGKAVFDKPITINGTIAFDIANATAELAQFGGFSFITGSTTTAYTLTAETPAVGTYLLATDAAAFDSTVRFGDVTLTVGAEAAIVGKYAYSLSLTEDTLALAIKDYIPTLAYVNSEWSDKKIDDIVTVGDKTAIIGFDAFATLAPAEAAVTPDGAVEIAGGTVSFAEGYSKTITVDAGATVVGKAVFDKAITINGTIAFDIANATAELAQFGGFSFITGSATTSYTLTALAPSAGVYLLATDVTAFTGTVKFGAAVLNVGTEPAVIGSYTYALTLDEGTLALTIEDYIPPTPTYDLIYVNSKWAALPSGSTVTVGEKTAVIGEDAFASGDVAIANVTADGIVEVVGNEVYFTNAITKSVTIDAGAALIGKAAFATAITVNGTVAFDTQYATAANAQFTGFSFVSGNAAYTLTDTAKAVGTYLLATDAAAFDSAVKFGNVTLTVGAEATLVGDYTYALTLNDGVLALTVAKFIPPTPVYDLVFVNSEWAALPSGSTVTVGEKSAVIGEDAFASGDIAIANVTADGMVEVVGGEVFFTNPIAKSVTIDADATLIGNNTFAKAITIDGTVAFDTQYATADNAQFEGFSFVSGTASYTLTDAEPAVGTYLLASGAETFTGSVAFGDVTLTVGAEAVPVGDFTYALSLNESALVLTVEDYIPPVPALAYVNSEWSGLEDGTPVQISETVTATIGYDAFAALAPAIAGVTEDGAVEIVGGEISFADGYGKTITVDAGATVVGTAVFDQAITINGTVAFDTAYATAEDAQFEGFSFVSGDTAYTLTDAEPAVGTYLLATGVETFTGGVTFEDVTLTVGAEPVPVGDFTYALTLNEGVLALTVEDYIPPTPTLAYVNSEWSGLPDKTVVTVGGKTAVIGYDAFAELAPAIAAVTDDGTVEIAGGTVSFAQGYSKTITVDADATVVGKGAFKTPITVYGTIAFDTQYMTSYYAQYTTFSNIVGSAAYTLTDSVKAAGTYQLASGAKGFKGDIKLSVYTLKVGGAPRRVGNFTYAVSLAGSSLSLTVAKAKAPSSRPKLVYVNSAWADMKDGTLVKVDSMTYATIGKDAFADGDTATSIVSTKGEILIVGGSAAFTDDTHNVTVSSGAVLELATEVNLAGATILDGGAMTAGFGAVVDGLDISGASASAAVVTGGTVADAFVSEGAIITISGGGLLLDAEVTGLGQIRVLNGGIAEDIDITENEDQTGTLVVSEGGSASGITVNGGSLTTENGSFLTGAVVFGGQTTIGGTATRVTLFDAMTVTGWGEVTKARVSSGGIISALRGDGIGSVLDSEILSGGIIRNASFVSDIQVKFGGILETSDSGIANATEVQSGGLFIVSGADAAARGLSLVEGGTVTVTDGARLTGRITAGDGASIGMDDGTVLEFDLSSLARPADYALVNDFSAIDGTPDLVLTVSSEQEGGVYLLAGGAASFDRGITLGEYTLTLDSEPVTIGTSTFSLNLSDDGMLSLFIDVPVFFVNSEWAGLEDGTVVTAEGVDAVIGVDAFATGDAAAAASPASAEIRVIGGTASFTEGIRKKTVIRSGVELTNTDVYATLTLEDGAVLSGKSMFDGDAAVFGEGTIIFDPANVEEGRPQFIGLSRIEGSLDYVLVPGATIGEYLFAADAADMLYQGIQVADGVTAYVGRAEFPVLKDESGAQLSYVFDVTQDNELTLSVVKVKNELDNGWNNYVYDKKAKVLNPLLDTFVSTALEEGVAGVLLDEKGTVFSDGRRNYVGGIKNGDSDEYDFAKITLEKSASLSFNLESTGAGKFTIWQLVTGTDKKGNVTYTMKSRQATSLKKDNLTGLYVATTKDLLIEAGGDYYISMQSTEAASKKGGYAFYNAELNYTDGRTHFFADGDDGWNNYVYDKKRDIPLNPAAADEDLLFNTVAKAGDAVQLDSPGTEFPLDDKVLTNFVGFGDDADYAAISLPCDSALAFNVTATDAAKFTIWQLVLGMDKKGNVTYKMKLIQTTALKKDNNTGLYSAETALRRFNLDDGSEYYVSVQSTNAKKGGSAYYSVVTSEESVFYTDADNGWNDYVYDKKREEPLNMAVYGSVGTLLYKQMGDIQIDTAGTVSEQVGGTTFTNYVGFGDDADYLKITLENTSKLSFNVTATNASKFVIYQLVEGTDQKGNTTYKMKEIQSTALKKADKYAEFYTVSGGTKPTKDLAAGDYYVAVVSTNAKKGDLVYYNVSLNDAGCSGLPDKPVEPENFPPAPVEPDSGTETQTVISANDPDELTGFDNTENTLNIHQPAANAPSCDLASAAVADFQEDKSAWQAMLA